MTLYFSKMFEANETIYDNILIPVKKKVYPLSRKIETIYFFSCLRNKFGISFFLGFILHPLTLMGINNYDLLREKLFYHFLGELLQIIWVIFYRQSLFRE